MLKISFPRGDSYEKGFILKNKQTKEAVLTDFDEIYFTVKKKSEYRQFLLQKRLSTGGIQNDGNGHYTLRILPADTNNMSFGTYVFDIEAKRGQYVKTFVGELELTDEVTHIENE